MQAPATGRPAGPPRPPEGWLVGPPDFVGVGAARSGTGWWDGLVHEHPGVARAPGTPTAVCFFGGRWPTELSDEDMEGYHAWFARPPGALAGEWTPDYMLDPWTPRLLRRATPHARLLVLLRDPVERFRSGWSGAEHHRSVGSTPRAAANAAFSRGLYADQLLRLWRAWPRERVLVLQYERCLREPGAELARTFGFLGLDPEPASTIEPDARLIEPGGAPPALVPWQERVLVERYAPENARLVALVPDLDLDLWRHP